MVLLFRNRFDFGRKPRLRLPVNKTKTAPKPSFFWMVSELLISKNDIFCILNSQAPSKEIFWRCGLKLKQRKFQTVSRRLLTNRQSYRQTHTLTDKQTIDYYICQLQNIRMPKPNPMNINYSSVYVICAHVCEKLQKYRCNKPRLVSSFLAAFMAPRYSVSNGGKAFPQSSTTDTIAELWVWSRSCRLSTALTSVRRKNSAHI